ncbi:MAG: hypothetical protein KGI50_05280 [Patescibacteria group bacterium]|nr:hypothetical protein [Patescibacteria group bacterium]MDE2438728.1 hypothetical protein [Patescibacteria group bacterium]
MKTKKTQEETVGADNMIALSNPYSFKVKIKGISNILFHRWDCESVKEKAKSPKGGLAKKTDDIESFVYRDAKGNLSIPAEYLRQSIIHAAKFKQDPRSPRKSAMDLYKAGIVSITDLSSLGKKNWDFLDKRRVVVQRAAITRSRPSMYEGWEAEFIFLVNTPEYITPESILDTINQAGKLVGVGDFRPTYGRFQVTNFEILED